MRIVYVHPGLYPPDIHAGTEVTMDWLFKGLIARGHQVVVTAPSETVDGPEAAVDHSLGYPVARYKYFADVTLAVTREFQPDVILMTQPGPWTEHMLPAIGQTPLVIYIHEVGYAVGDAPAEIRAKGRFIANSPITAAHLRDSFGLTSSIVRPLFGVDQYKDIHPNGETVLFVSVQMQKGADLVLRLAEARPNARFLLIESWTQDPDGGAALRAWAQKLPNVTLLGNQNGLGHILPHVRLVLMPTRGAESWGRTVTEAQMCGIPVLGSNRGALASTIGPGGFSLDPDGPFEQWLAAFDAVMGDPGLHADLSRKAMAHARAFIPQIEQDYRDFEQILLQAVRERAA